MKGTYILLSQFKNYNGCLNDEPKRRRDIGYEEPWFGMDKVVFLTLLSYSATYKVNKNDIRTNLQP